VRSPSAERLSFEDQNRLSAAAQGLTFAELAALMQVAFRQNECPMLESPVLAGMVIHPDILTEKSSPTQVARLPAQLLGELHSAMRLLEAGYFCESGTRLQLSPEGRKLVSMVLQHLQLRPKR